jgi:CheY-like chemotaxis protein
MGDKTISILLIEDNPGDGRLIQEFLADAQGIQFDLVRAERFSAGLKRLERGGIDVVLLDLALPDSRGLETFRQVRGHVPDVPVPSAVDTTEIGAQLRCDVLVVIPNALEACLRAQKTGNSHSWSPTWVPGLGAIDATRGVADGTTASSGQGAVGGVTRSARAGGARCVRG